jgi:hypothetical protein
MIPTAALCSIGSRFARLQCLEAASADQDKRVCDLKPGAQTIILLLSCITVSRRVVLDRCAGLARMAREQGCGLLRACSLGRCSR